MKNWTLYISCLCLALVFSLLINLLALWRKLGPRRHRRRFARSGRNAWSKAEIAALERMYRK